MDLRQHFALERTLLAYIRTGLALVGVGFVVARFGLLLRELGVRSGAPQTAGWSLWFGVLLVLLGGLVGPMATATYLQQLRRLNRSLNMDEKPVQIAIALSVVVTLVGFVMAAYLALTG